MASSSPPTSVGAVPLREFFDEDVCEQIQRAVDAHDYSGVEEFVQEATRQLLDECLDGDGNFACPHDDCDESFVTRRQLRGHLGSSEHALDVPDGDFWCGYCGYGPTTWRGVNAHHGQSSHDGDPVRLDEEPGHEDLLAPDDVPDHQNPDLLAELYERYDGNYTEMCRQYDFDVGPGRVRHYLIEFGIHEVTPQGATDGESGPKYRDREWLETQYKKADGNISEMHRQIDIEVPYRTLVKNLKRFGIHDPTDPPGKRHGKGGPKSSTANEAEDCESDGEDGNEDDAVDDEKNEVVDRGEDDGTSFSDLDTPGWIDEASFYQAIEMADDVDELADILGWPGHDSLEQKLDRLDIDLAGGDA